MNTCNNLSVEIVRFGEFQKQIESIRRSVFILEQRIPESLEWDDYEYSSWHCIAHRNNEPAGTGRLQQDGKITRIAVLKHWRGQGVASTILKKLLKTATENQLNNIYLNAQTSAVALYENFGFVGRGEVFDEGGIEHLRMELQ